jgi:hypothetical protein
MNQEEPTLPAYQSKPITGMIPSNSPDAPMDEFEYTGKGSKAGIKNMLKFIKFASILIVVIAVIGFGLYFIKNSLTAPSTNVTATATPEASLTATERPQITYPTEYDDVQKDVTAYDQSVNSVSDTRTRIEAPSINFGIAF